MLYEVITNVFDVQAEIKGRTPANVDDILDIPLLGDQQLTARITSYNVCYTKLLRSTLW